LITLNTHTHTRARARPRLLINVVVAFKSIVPYVS